MRFFFFLLFFFTNFNYRYITFTGTITTAITGPATSLTTVPAVSATAVAPAAAGGGARDASRLKPLVCFILCYLFYYTNNDRYQVNNTSPPPLARKRDMGWFLFFMTSVSIHHTTNPATPAAVATVSGVTGAAAVGQREGIETQNIIQVDYHANEIAF